MPSNTELNSTRVISQTAYMSRVTVPGQEQLSLNLKAQKMIYFNKTSKGSILLASLCLQRNFCSFLGYTESFFTCKH